MIVVGIQKLQTHLLLVQVAQNPIQYW